MRARSPATAARFLALAALALVAGCGGGAAAAPQPVGRAGASLAQAGDVALDYVAAQPYASLLVEVDFVQGVAPDPDALEVLRETLARRLSKPEGVYLVIDSEIPRSFARSRWQQGDLLAIESQFRRNHTGDRANPTQAVLWLVYLPGRLEGEEGGVRALGVAFGASAIAVFPESIERTTPAEAREVVEALVLVHESGHIAGLVNNGLPMVRQHEDPENARHDDGARCVMHHRIETGELWRLLDAPPLEFCHACRLDLYDAGGPPPGLDDGAAAASPLLPAGYDPARVSPLPLGVAKR
jgi:hypothetical protein